ncbi:hypothetical protein EDB83DRAFT_317904 [Lactarius deliciosus]|nr:hypothetical protein EDB83DRAFT_317904 [Lactarius deliciosus]
MSDPSECPCEFIVGTVDRKCSDLGSRFGALNEHIVDSQVIACCYRNERSLLSLAVCALFVEEPSISLKVMHCMPDYLYFTSLRPLASLLIWPAEYTVRHTLGRQNCGRHHAWELPMYARLRYGCDVVRAELIVSDSTSCCPPKIWLVSCPASSSDDPATITAAEGILNSTCMNSGVVWGLAVKANVTGGDPTTALCPSRREIRLFRETRSVLEYLRQYPSTVSHDVRNTQDSSHSFPRIAVLIGGVSDALNPDGHSRISRDVRADEPALVLRQVAGSVIEREKVIITYGKYGHRQERYDPHGC